MASSPDGSTPHTRPTRIRYAVVALATLTSVLLYLDRVCVSIAARFIRDDLNLSKEQVGVFLGAFFWTYALSQVPAGWLSDRFGARKMLTLYVLGWSLATALLGVAWGIVSLLALRCLLGVAQAGAYPTCAALLGRWVPYTARGSASSIVAAGGRLGGFLAPVLTGILIVAFVPISVPSTISQDDIIDPVDISVKLFDSSPAGKWSNPSKADGEQGLVEIPPSHPALAWQWDQLNATGQQLVAKQAKITIHVTERHKRLVKEAKKQGKTPPPLPEPTPADLQRQEQLRTVFADSFDANLLSSEWYTAARFEGVDVEPEALKIANLGDASEEQLRRQNRLLLEAVFPDSIRKVYRAGWRPVMFVYGLFGIVVAILFWFGFRDDPRDHPWCNQAEVEHIEYGRPPTRPKSKVGGVPIKEIVSSRSMWMSCLSQFGTNIGWVFLITWLPTYLADVHRVPTVMRGWMASLVLGVGWAGMLMGGPATDYLSRKLGIRWGRALPISVSRFIAMAAYIGCLFGPSPWVATALFSVVAISTDFGVPATWAFNQDVGGRHVGSILGFGNMCGNLGAAVAPMMVIALVGDPPNWDMAFVVGAVAFLVAGVAGLFIDASIRIAPAED